MAKKISMLELQNMASRGAHIKQEEKPVEVVGIDMIAMQLAAMIEANKQENQKQLNILVGAVNRITSAIKADDPAIKEIKSLLGDIADQPPQPSYKFKIERNSKNLITSVVATPVIIFNDEGDK